MPLQNRVDPSGRIVRHAARGLFMGNRGGALHNADQQIVRVQKSKTWITCLTEYKNRKRKLMQPGGYTELFFLDEAVSLSAGHRPCFECRRQDALAFGAALARARGMARLSAPQIDDLLEADRMIPADHPSRQVSMNRMGSLPDGAFVRNGDHHFVVRSGQLLRWSFEGYEHVDSAALMNDQSFDLATPGASLEALRHGYRPVFHPSAIANFAGHI
ncbi:hypothetical protein [Hoeflea sp.]|uniref:hypothetical protein n=1 Tax=Hoeflea sp. TaxID=1940281 RepID=UPI003747C733